MRAHVSFGELLRITSHVYASETTTTFLVCIDIIFISFHLLIYQQFHHQQQFQRVKADNKLLIGHNRVTLMFVFRKYFIFLLFNKIHHTQLHTNYRSHYIEYIMETEGFVSNTRSVYAMFCQELRH